MAQFKVRKDFVYIEYRRGTTHVQRTKKAGELVDLTSKNATGQGFKLEEVGEEIPSTFPEVLKEIEGSDLQLVQVAENSFVVGPVKSDTGETGEAMFDTLEEAQVVFDAAVEADKPADDKPDDKPADETKPEEKKEEKKGLTIKSAKALLRKS